MANEDAESRGNKCKEFVSSTKELPMEALNERFDLPDPSIVTMLVLGGNNEKLMYSLPIGWLTSTYRFYAIISFLFN